jgi:SAM-dependent methyltransferase
MTSAARELTVADRLLALLQHLGIERAHVAGRLAADWAGIVAVRPEMVASLTLLNSFEPRTVAPLAGRLLVVTGDQGAMPEMVRQALADPATVGARHVCLPEYNLFAWSDVAVERGEEFATALLPFLAAIECAPVLLPEGDGEIAGLAYRIRGAGPPLVLLPLFLSPSQWEPLMPRLAERYCTVTLGGPHLGAVAVLEARGRAIGYRQMLRTLIEAAGLRPGESVLEVGCGCGAVVRWLARDTTQRHPITGVDINRYLLREAAALAARDELAEAIELREGNAEALPLPDASFDVVISVTVIEETDADRMLAEMVRVTKPGGRVAVIARSVDLPFVMNMPLSPALKAKVERPGAVGGVAPAGCADASLYRRMREAGLSEIRMMPLWPAFDQNDRSFVDFIQGGLLQQLTAEETQEWSAARAQAEAEGTFFLAWPHHAVVATRPG